MTSEHSTPVGPGEPADGGTDGGALDASAGAASPAASSTDLAETAGAAGAADTAGSERRRTRLVPARTRSNRPPTRLRRRLGAAVRLIAALTLVGGLHTLFTPGVGQAEDPVLSQQALEGKQLYEASCITCHGTNGQGVDGRGPSLIGVGGAAVHFQVETGRMPLARQEAQAERKPPLYTGEEARKIAAYIQAIGGGPQLPSNEELARLIGEGDIANGGELFRVNCSSCHAFSTGGGALSSGKFAPTLREASSRDLFAAMLTGPQNMPVFGDNQLTAQEKADIIAYIQNLNDQKDPGGFALGRYGPVPEGIVIFLLGMGVLVFATLWIAGKS
jgi:ubiquinol-cytochrome c reductase cytochrome c subunit